MRVNRSNLEIVSAAHELDEGLFGQVILFPFEVLAYLQRRGLYPAWDIRAKHYGAAPDNRAIPGVLDLAYEVQGSDASQPLRLSQLRGRHVQVLGGDFAGLSALWKRYFRIPDRVLAAADAVGDLSETLGVHYRGNDKNTASWDTNPVSHEDYLTIVQDVLARRPDLKRVFLATDEHAFYRFLAERLPVEIVNLGEVGFHKDEGAAGALDEKADRAVLDCVLLSRCALVLKTSSALSGFAKVLNPELEIYRCSASKRFTDVPYFPVAYIPPIQPVSAEAKAVVERLMVDDWTQGPDADRFKRPFIARPRRPLRDLVWSAVESMLGLEAASRIGRPRRAAQPAPAS